MGQREQYRTALRAMVAEVSRQEDDERRLIASRLHDDVGQLLVTAKLRLGLLRREVPAEQRATIDEVSTYLVDALHSTRTLTLQLLAPATLETSVVAALAELTETLAGRHGGRYEFTADVSAPTLTSDAARAVYRAVRELIENIATHAKVDAASIDVAATNDELHVVVADRGVGFDPTAIGGMDTYGMGLLIVEERLIEVGGRVLVESAVGEGTRVTLSVPLRPAGRADDGRAPAP